MIRFDYMTWAKSLPPVRFNLARSGVMKIHRTDLSLEVEGFDINGPNEYGYEPLKQSIAARYHVRPEQVVLTQGASFANHLVYAALLQPGDEAIVEQPAYEVLHKLPLLFHASVKRLPRQMENQYQIDPDDLKKLISNRTRLIVLTNLHNPTGARLEDDILKEIGRIAESYNAHVLVDEVYLEAYYQERPAAAATLGDTFITTSSLTKAYGLDGLRCGWIICKEKLATRLRRLNDFYGVVGVFIAEQIGAALFAQLKEIAKIHQGYLLENKRRFRSFLDNYNLLQCLMPDAGMIAFPALMGIDSSHEFVTLALKKFDIALVPGRFFESPAHFRIAWGLPTKEFTKALERLKNALD